MSGAPFPAICPACGAPIVTEPWTDPVTQVVYERTVNHRGDCRIYRERDYDRSELVAHLAERRCACERPGVGRGPECHRSYYGGDRVYDLRSGEPRSSCICSCHRSAAA